MMKKRITVIDGQGGKMGAALIARITELGADADVYAVGTNAAATAAMAKGAAGAATGEGAVKYAARRSNVIVGPVGIVIADSLLGEITPEMAAAVGQSDAVKILIPVNRCGAKIVGAKSLSFGDTIEEAAREAIKALENKEN